MQDPIVICFSSFHNSVLCIVTCAWAFDGHQQVSSSPRWSHPPFLLFHMPPTFRSGELLMVLYLLRMPLNTLYPLLRMSFLFLLAWLTLTCPLGHVNWAFTSRSSPWFSLICFFLDSFNTWYTFLISFCIGQSLLTRSPAILLHFLGPLKQPHSKVCSKTQPCSVPWCNLTRVGCQ